MTQVLTRHRFTVDDYHRMGESGILGPDERVELIDGEIVQMSPIGSRHNSTVMRLNRAIVPRVGGRALVSVQGAVRLGPHDEPQPDLLLLRPRADDYMASLPEASDVLLVMEVADSTLAYDRDIKSRLYARAGIGEYWLWDLTEQRVLVHREPSADGYGQVLAARPGETLSPLGLANLTINTGDIF